MTVPTLALGAVDDTIVCPDLDTSVVSACTTLSADESASRPAAARACAELARTSTPHSGDLTGRCASRAATRARRPAVQLLQSMYRVDAREEYEAAVTQRLQNHVAGAAMLVDDARRLRSPLCVIAATTRTWRRATNPRPVVRPRPLREPSTAVEAHFVRNSTSLALSKCCCPLGKLRGRVRDRLSESLALH